MTIHSTKYLLDIYMDKTLLDARDTSVTKIGGRNLSSQSLWSNELKLFWYTTMHLPQASLMTQVKNVCWCRRHKFNPWVRKTPWRRKWQPTPVFLPEKSHGQRSLVGYSPWGCKELDMTEHIHTQIIYHQLSLWWPKRMGSVSPLGLPWWSGG